MFVDEMFRDRMSFVGYFTFVFAILYFYEHFCEMNIFVLLFNNFGILNSPSVNM